MTGHDVEAAARREAWRASWAVGLAVAAYGVSFGALAVAIGNFVGAKTSGQAPEVLFLRR